MAPSDGPSRRRLALVAAAATVAAVGNAVAFSEGDGSVYSAVAVAGFLFVAVTSVWQLYRRRTRDAA